jgi:hypothetical protein
MVPHNCYTELPIAPDTWTPTPPMVRRFLAAATLLENGKVFVAGGDQNVGAARPEVAGSRSTGTKLISVRR